MLAISMRRTGSEPEKARIVRGYQWPSIPSNRSREFVVEGRVILHERQRCRGVEAEFLLAVRSPIPCADDVAPLDLRNLDARVGVKVVCDAARDLIARRVHQYPKEG